MIEQYSSGSEYTTAFLLWISFKFFLTYILPLIVLLVIVLINKKLKDILKIMKQKQYDSLLEIKE